MASNCRVVNGAVRHYGRHRRRKTNCSQKALAGRSSSVQQRRASFGSELMEAHPNGRHEAVTILPGRAVLYGRIGQASFAAEFASPVMVHDCQSVGNVGGDVTGPEFPNEVIAHLDDNARAADILGSYSACRVVNV